MWEKDRSGTRQIFIPFTVVIMHNGEGVNYDQQISKGVQNTGSKWQLNSNQISDKWSI